MIDRSKFGNIPLLRNAFQQAFNYAANEKLHDLADTLSGEVYGYNGNLLESPAEVVFAAWFKAHEICHGSQNFMLVPQVPFQCGSERYRVDFQVHAVRCRNYPQLSAVVPLDLVVEIDGHAFHERTRSQVYRRDCRDRDLQAIGLQVYHFSFGELMADPLRCVREVADAAWRISLKTPLLELVEE